METVRNSEIGDLEPGQRIEARIAEGKKGLTAVELQLGSSDEH
jgi:CspA family cold shock protein